MTFLRPLAAAALALGLALAWIAPAAAPAKTLRIAYDADPVSLDPHEQLSDGTLQLSHLLFDPLVRWTPDLQFEPRLAQSWERVDARTVRFHLREDVRFHSGNPMTARDVVWTFERLKSSPDFKAIFAAWDRMTAIDDFTVELRTVGPDPLVLHAATYVFPMDSAFYRGRAEIVKHSNSFASQNVSGTGPFTVAAREPGVRLFLERNLDYWDLETPGNVTTILLTPIGEPAARVAALLAGEVDLIAPVPPGDLERLSADPAIDLVTLPGTRIVTLQLNQARVEAFRDVRVRQAIVHAIDNAGIVEKTMKGFGTVAAQLSPEGYLGHNPALLPRFDLAAARKLMEEAGYGTGLGVSMMCPDDRYVNDRAICEAVAAMLAGIGIEVELTTLPKSQYWPEFDARAADIMMIGWQSDTADSANFYEFLAMTPDPATGRGQYNSGGYSNAKVDELTLASLTQTDPEARAGMLREVEQILYDEAAFVPLHWQDLAWAARRGVQIGRVVNAMDLPYLGDLVVE